MDDTVATKCLGLGYIYSDCHSVRAIAAFVAPVLNGSGKVDKGRKAVWCVVYGTNGEKAVAGSEYQLATLDATRVVAGANSYIKCVIAVAKIYG